jgi:hypothetical protein
MASYGEFSSLLQLGVGIGIGLSIFKAPIDLRTNRIGRALDAEILALRGGASDFTKQKRRELMMLRLHFLQVRESLERLQRPFMVTAVAGAILNLLFLIKASLDASAQVSRCMIWVLLFTSIGLYLLVGCGLEILARYKLSTTIRDLKKIRASQAPH